MEGLLTIFFSDKNVLILHFSRKPREIKEKETITLGELKLMK